MGDEFQVNDYTDDEQEAVALAALVSNYAILAVVAIVKYKACSFFDPGTFLQIGLSVAEGQYGIRKVLCRKKF